MTCKQLRAKARALVLFTKKKSWIDFVSQINRPKSCATMWNHIPRITRMKSSFIILLLEHKNQTFTNLIEISCALTQHRFRISSPDLDQHVHTAMLKHQHSSSIEYPSWMRFSLPELLSLPMERSNCCPYTSTKLRLGPAYVLLSLSLIHI